MDHMRISDNEHSSVILGQSKYNLVKQLKILVWKYQNKQNKKTTQVIKPLSANMISV